MISFLFIAIGFGLLLVALMQYIGVSMDVPGLTILFEWSMALNAILGGLSLLYALIRIESKEN